MPLKKKSRSGTTFDKNTFVSDQTALRYNEFNKKRLAIPEWGVDVPGPINDEIKLRHWEKLCAHHDPAILPVVMEFYTNAKEDGVTDTVFARGRWVCFNADAINHVYDLSAPDESHAFHDYLESDVDWIEVIEALCKGQTNWKYCKNSQEVSAFPTKQLAAIPRAWFYFISAKLMPATHLSSVHKNRAALLFAILNDIPVTVGRIMNEDISICIKDESLAFVGPCLITFLCKAAGVTWSAGEPLVHERGMFDTRAINSMKYTISSLGSNEDYEHPPPPPRKQSIWDKQEQLEKMVNDHIAEFSDFKSNFLDHQRRLEALFEYQRQANEVFHQFLMELAKEKQATSVVLPPLPPFPLQEVCAESDLD